MAKMYTLDEKLLVGTPEVRIGEKIYPIDDRKKTVKKIIKMCDENANKNDIDVIDEVFKLAFSAKDFKEIEGLDMSFNAYKELFELVLAAVTGEDPDKMADRFQKEKQ